MTAVLQSLVRVAEIATGVTISLCILAFIDRRKRMF